MTHYYPGISALAEGHAILAAESRLRAASAFGKAATGIRRLPEMHFERVFRDLERTEMLSQFAQVHADRAAQLVIENRPTAAWENHVKAAHRLCILTARCTVRIRRTLRTEIPNR